MKRGRAVFVAVSLVACAPSRPAASPAAEPSSSAAAPGSELVPAAPVPEPEDAATKPLLVSRSVLESSHLGNGGDVLTVVVTETGEVILESRRWGADGKMEGPTAHPCRTLSAAELDELRRLVEQAQAAIGAASYSTSSHPPPTANYSRSETYRFSPSARFPEVTVAGWADLPRALSHLGGELARLQASCAP